MNIKKYIPNIITCGNLLCGCIAIKFAFQGNLVWASYLVGIAAVLDFFDGFAARMLKVSSPIGKDLDSLADMVTFGVVPGVIMYQLIQLSLSDMIMVDGEAGGWALYPTSIAEPLIVNERRFIFPDYIKYIAFSIPVFSAIRLAKFNHDTRQTSSFIGLPTPANAILICSIPLILFFDYDYHYFSQQNRIFPLVLLSNNEGIVAANILEPIRLCVFAIIMSLLLVSEIPLFALKFRNFSWRGNRIRFVFLITSIFLLVIFKIKGIAFVIVFYVLLSVITHLYSKRSLK